MHEEYIIQTRPENIALVVMFREQNRRSQTYEFAKKSAVYLRYFFFLLFSSGSLIDVHTFQFFSNIFLCCGEQYVTHFLFFEYFFFFHFWHSLIVC